MNQQQYLPAIADEAYERLTVTIVRRSLSLRVRQAERGVFYVDGGYEPHWVNLYDTSVPRCDCVDHEARNRICKHLVAVLLHIGDKRLWRRLRQMRDEHNNRVES